MKLYYFLVLFLSYHYAVIPDSFDADDLDEDEMAHIKCGASRTKFKEKFKLNKRKRYLETKIQAFDKKIRNKKILPQEKQDFYNFLDELEGINKRIAYLEASLQKDMCRFL